MKTPKPSIPLPDVLAWLKENHPHLHATAEIDRNWCWITENLSGESNKAVRESLKASGFRFAKRGHVLPSGKAGTWANSCTAPLPFYRKSKGGSRNAAPTTHEQPEPETDAALDEALAFANA